MNYLPQDFADLERFVAAGWALPREHARWARRVSSTVAEVKDFYETTLPRMDAIVQYLDRNPLESVPPNERPLLYLALAFMDVAPRGRYTPPPMYQNPRTKSIACI